MAFIIATLTLAFVLLVAVSYREDRLATQSFNAERDSFNRHLTDTLAALGQRGSAINEAFEQNLTKEGARIAVDAYKELIADAKAAQAQFASGFDQFLTEEGVANFNGLFKQIINAAKNGISCVRGVRGSLRALSRANITTIGEVRNAYSSLSLITPPKLVVDNTRRAEVDASAERAFDGL
jgi:hypothetical protein